MLQRYFTKISSDEVVRENSHHLIKTYREVLRSLTLTTRLPLLFRLGFTHLGSLLLLLAFGFGEEDVDLAARTDDFDATAALGQAEDTNEQINPLDRTFDPTSIDDEVRVHVAELFASAVTAVLRFVLVHLATEAVHHVGHGSEEPLVVRRAG